MISNQDIVISGISGRLPESSNIEEFKQNLINEIDMVTDDERRWSASIYGLPARSGKIKNLSSFDASFFGVHAKQAEVMDPQVRILLEVTYEALIDAGINPSTVRGSRVGVFIGVSTSDSEDYWLQAKSNNLSGYEMLGSFRAMVANRISFAFDFIGPSCTLDTACSASLSAVHMAVSAIRAGECDAAVVGGLHLLLRPEHSINLNKLGVLSQDGKSKTFDITADGYVRAEAIIAIYLQKAKDARRIYSTIIHTKINTDGYKPQGITHPNGEMQNQLLREIYNKAGINPADVVYVEAHGTGTAVGDPVELNSIDKIFCKNRKTPLLIGSVKSNMGHAEAASGLCSIAKVLIAMEMGVIPANLHFSTPNPKIPALSRGRMQVINEATQWNGGLAAINSFGFGGVNVHVILRSNPKPKLLSARPSLDIANTLPKLILVSGRTEEAVHVLLNKTNEHSKDNEFISLLHTIHNSNITGHRYRGYEILDGNDTREVSSEITNYNVKRPIWFVFSGMGAQWSGMGRDLLKIEICKRSLQRCTDVLVPHGIDLISIIINSTKETYQNVINSFVSIVAIQIALVDLLASIDIHPNGIVGHSVGELGCAYADGAFTLEQSILCAYYRGKSIVNSKLESGAMAAIGLNWEEVEKICPPDISPACHNSLDSVTVSGPSELLRIFTEELKSKGIFTKMVDSSGIAFHSKHIKPIESKLRILLEKIIPNPKARSAKWISTSVPKSAWDKSFAQFSSAEYHVNNVLSPVLFQEAIAHIPKNAITIEIAPHCILQTILYRSLSPTVTNISLQKRCHPNNVMFLLSNVGKLYMAGAQPDVSKLYPLVNFPVSRGTPMIGSLVKWDHSVEWKVPTYKKKQNTSEYVVKIDLSEETYAFLSGHKIDGRIIFPGAGHIMLVWKTFAKLHNIDFERFPVVFENIWFQRATIMPKEGTVKFLINIFKKTGIFEICEADTVVVRGNVRAFNTSERNQLKISSLTTSSANKNFLPLNTKDVYKELSLRGYQYRDIFQGIKSCDNYATTGELYWFDEWISYMDTMFQFSILSGSRKLVYGSYIRYMGIDPIRHKQLISELSEDNSLPVYYYKNVDIVKSGGIEIKGIKHTSPQRLQVQTNLKCERRIFVPYENPYSLAEDSMNGTLHALTVLLQIIQENITTFQIKAVEVAGGRTVETLLAPLVLNILHSEPLLTIDLQIFAASSNNYTESFNQMNLNIDVVIQDVNNAPPANNVHLIIATDVLSKQSYNVLKNLTTALKPGCFILLEESAALLLDDLKTLLTTDLILVGKQTNSAGKTYLLLKKQKNKGEQIVINITEKNLMWLDSVKAALRKYDNKGHEMLFVSQGTELCGLIGLMTRIRCEIGDANARYVFIQDKNAPTFDLSTQFYADQLNKGLMANVLKEGHWGSYRYLQLDQQSKVWTEHAYVNALTKGNLNSLTWIQSPLKEQRSDISSNTRQYSVYYAAINTRDLMLASGKSSLEILPEKMKMEEPILGLEFSGRAVDGHRVMGIVKAGGLATTVLADPDFLWKIPDKWTLEEAATIPVAYAISYYALFVRGQLKADESILIQIGTDGIGQAAITLALHIGCTVFITVSTPDKKKYIQTIFPQLPDRYVGISQDISFEQLILIETQERGVDVLMNSLAEEESQISSRCLAINGRVLGIGNHHDLSNGYSLKNMTFHSIRLEALLEECAEKKEVARLISQGIENEIIHPLSSIVFSEQQFEEGFKFLSTDEHMNKVLLKIRDEESHKRVPPTPKLVSAASRTYMNPEKSYILVGGLEGFGLELADWMITRGAKFIVLVTSLGVRTGYQALCLRRWSEKNINVVISMADIATLSNVEQLIKESKQLAPVGGIFNLATILGDTLIDNLKEADFKRMMLLKIDGTKNLDAVSRRCCPLLDYFVVFSCVRENIAGCNVAFANSAMERTIEHRQTAGMPGLAIQWGAIEDTGMDIIEDNDIARNGILPQRISSCLATIDIFLQQSHQILRSTVIAEKHKPTDDSKVNLVKTIVNILGIKDINLANPNDSFTSLGMDSLGYMEIKQTLEKIYNISLSSQEISSLTIAKLKDLSLLNLKNN